jgi:S1-C subfamily serine protease
MNRVLILALAILIATPHATSPALARAMESGDAAVARDAMPAVVNISTWRVKPPEQPGGSPRRVKTYGSGFIIDPSGLIVTNKHVIDGSIDIKVIFNDGDRVPAKLLAVAAMIDLAVLKVDAGRPLPALKWGDSENLHVGDAVLAIGNPLGLGESVSSGIVSALNRDIQDTPFDDYIQTDAAINHGNSGGPLIDSHGRVIGVTSQISTGTTGGQGNVGIGFAIPINTVRNVAAQIISSGKALHAFLGLDAAPVTPQLARLFHLPSSSGLLIQDVQAGSGADKAGLKAGKTAVVVQGESYQVGGDMIVAIDGTPVTTYQQLRDAISQRKPGDKLKLEIYRNGSKKTVTAKLGQRG